VDVINGQNGLAKAKDGGSATVTPGGVSCSGKAKAKLHNPGGGKLTCP